MIDKINEVDLKGDEDRDLEEILLEDKEDTFIEYDDFCNQVSKTIQQDSVNGIINICSGRPERLADRVERFIKDNDLNIHLVYVF